MGYQPRILEKFENAAGTVSYSFPIAEYEYESSQGLRVPSVQLVGVHYPFDLLGNAPGLKDAGHERLRFEVLEATPSLVDTAVDELLSKVWKIGCGKLYAIDNAGARRWAWARAQEMPALTWRAGNIFSKAAVLSFRRDSDWYDTTITNEGEAINADPDTITITNAGNAPVWNAIITVKGTFTDPSVANSTTGYQFSSTRDGSDAAHWLKIDCGRRTVEFSSDGGSTYADDMALFTRGASQVNFMKLDSGANSWTVQGCNGAEIACDFYGAYH